MQYSGDSLNEIVFPLGGIGSGCIGLKGNGQLVDFEIFNRPNKNSDNGYTHLAIRTIDADGKVNARILNGDVTSYLTGIPLQKRSTGFGFGPRSNSMCGFPHFRNCVFDGNFPFADIALSDDDFSGSVRLRAFNPMIPGDALNSSVPAAFFRTSYKNTSDAEIDVDFVFAVCNPFKQGKNQEIAENGITAVKLLGSGTEYDSEVCGDITLAAKDDGAYVQSHWFRGTWMDAVVSYWNEMTSGKPFVKRHYDEEKSKDHALICVRKRCKAGEEAFAEFVLSWSVPNCRNYWDANAPQTTWKNYYATVWKDSLDSATYSLNRFSELEARSQRFTNALLETTVDGTVLEAAMNTMSVLKTPTVLRLENGEFYGWEGLQEKAGSCEGTCQHVWNYAYALCFLFPELERSVRDLQFQYNMDEIGGMQFRLKLPLGAPRGTFHCCVDGQMGEIVKVWREWKLSGKTDWMRTLYPRVKAAMSYAFHKDNPYKWDYEHVGVLTGRQHHTLDVELFGPSSWLEGFYLLALRACAEMARAANDDAFADECEELFAKGYEYTDRELFNGSYYIQKIDLNDLDIPRSFDANYYVNDETGEIKYQIGEGSEIDQMCAQWHANILGLGRIYDKNKTKTALESMYKNNFKRSMRTHTNPWRIFALNDEAGTVICDYPQGVYKPKIPLPYCEESMHGFEYQFAGLLISEGMIEEGLNVVRAVRARYRGYNRNPWNEIECGSNYARSMAAFALIPIFAGFSFDLCEKSIGFAPLVNRDNFKTFWAVDGAYGTFSLTPKQASLQVFEGRLRLKRLKIANDGIEKAICDGREALFERNANELLFAEELCVERELTVLFDEK